MDTNYFSKSFFESHSFLNDSDRKKLLELATIKRFPANTVILKSGEFQPDIGVVMEGIIRVYGAKDKSVHFVTEGQIFGSMDSVVLKKNSRYNYETLEETVILLLNYDELEAAIQTHPNISILLLNYWKQTAMSLFKGLNSFIKYSPEERYEQLIKKQPHLVLRVKSKYLASYLGIHPVSLSRLKKRYLKNTDDE